ncbi:MAG: ABC transporter ATP-binding protein [Candidatus Kapaibacterium sp.]
MIHDSARGADYKSIEWPLVRRLLAFLRPYRGKVAGALALTIFVSAMGPLRPYLTKVVIDDYITPGDWDGLVPMIGLIFGLLVVHGILQFGFNLLMQHVGMRVLYDMRMKLFGHIQSLSSRFFDKNPVGRLVTRVTNDIEVLNNLFTSGFVMIVADVLLIFWLIGFMFYTNWLLSLMTLAILPFLLVVTSVFRRKVRVLFREVRIQVSNMNSFLNEFISGISTVKLFAQEKRQKKKFDEYNRTHKDLMLDTIFYYAIFFPTIELLSAVAISIILWYTAGNILSGMMTVGTLVAFIQYAEMFFRPVRDLTEKYTTLQSAMASSERIFELMDTEDFVPDGENQHIYKLEKGIEFKDVKFSYEEDKPVLCDVSFRVNKGETVAIVGSTGSGKTTLINLLCRFYDFQDGAILFDGKDIRDLPQREVRSLIALVMQDVFMFSRTLADNISLGRDDISRERIESAARAIGAAEFIEQQSNGYDTELNERGASLSSGQRQLVAFSRAFAADPDILILDEATSNIDSESEAIIEKSLDKLFAGRTSIVIAHRLSTIRRADRIIVLHHGRVRETGTHEELLEKGGLYKKLYELQYSNELAFTTK